MPSLPEETSALTPDQIKLVKDSWSQLSAKTMAVSDSFYERLFKMDGNLQSFFDSTDMEQQGKKFADTITVIVKGLDQFDVLGPAIQELGSRHVGYGVKNPHYTIVRSALIDAIEIQSTSGFSEETRRAWESTYDAVTELMTKGSSGQPLTSPGL